MNTGRGLPRNVWLLNNGFWWWNRRGGHHGFDRRGIRLRGSRGGCGCRNGAVTVWPFSSGSYSSNSPGVARAPENSTSSGSTAAPAGTVLNLLVFIHTFTGEERGIRFASKRVGKFFRDALATRQGTAQNTGTTRFTTLYRGLVFLIVFLFIVVIIDPRIVAAGSGCWRTSGS